MLYNATFVVLLLFVVQYYCHRQRLTVRYFNGIGFSWLPNANCMKRIEYSFFYFSLLAHIYEIGERVRKRKFFSFFLVGVHEREKVPGQLDFSLYIPKGMF